MSAVNRTSPQTLDPPRLLFLDGIRGLAALYVALHHAALMIPPQGLAGPALAVRFLLRHGHSAVAVFIVLSGYCLMLPAACDRSGHTVFNFGAFLRRRGRRILPPYFGALLFCWILIALIPDLGQTGRSPWDRALPATEPGVVVSHLFLVHNLSERWLFKIDPPMWSVATEWQIYLGFPVLFGLWRRSGIAAAIAAGFAVGYTVAALAVPLENPALRELCPWFAGLFALGMAAALAAHGERPVGGRRSGSVGPVSVVLGLVALVALGLAIAGTDNRNFMLADPAVGVVMAGLLVRWTRRVVPRAGSPRLLLFRLLEGRPAIALGSISYSLYLIHYPLLAASNAILRRWQFGPEARLWVLLLGASPAILLAATLFHRVFERPFRSARRQSTVVPAPTGPAAPPHFSATDPMRNEKGSAQSGCQRAESRRSLSAP